MTFESKHDVSRQGPLKADPADEAAPGGVLCSLADLVGWVQYRDDMPRRPAAAVVVDELDRAAPPLYLTNCGTWATRLPAEYVWRKAVDERAGRVREQVATRAGNWATDWGQMLGSRFEVRRTVVEPRAASPGAYGEPGAWLVLHEAWCSDGTATRDEATKKHGTTQERLAIPMPVALELFGYGQPAGVAPGWPSSVEAAGIALGANAHPAQSGPSAEEWTDERIANRLAELKRQTPTLKAPMNDLLAEMGLEVNSANKRDVQRKVKTFNDDRQSASLDTVWPGRIVHMA